MYLVPTVADFGAALVGRMGDMVKVQIVGGRSKGRV